MVKASYKQTEIGLIPEDWEVSNLNELLKLLTDFEANGSFENVAQNVRIYDSENYAWYVRATDLEKKSSMNEVKFVDKSSYDFLIKTKLFGDELLITKRGEIGKLYYFFNKFPFATLAPNMYLLQLNNKVIGKYLFYHFKSEIGNKKLTGINASSTLGAIYKDDVKKIKIPLPPLPEQTAIAEALSDADAWIESLEQLIAKKRLIKQGAMQTLLTPPSHAEPDEAWEVRKLGEMVNLITKGTTPTSVGKDFVDSGINFIKIESITKNGRIDLTKVAFIDESTNEILSRSKIQENDILFSIAGALGRTAIVKKEILPANTNQALGIIRLKENTLDRVFLYYFFNTSEFQQMLNTISVTGAQPNLSLFNLNEFEILFPKSKEEQTRIATILSDMDAELEALEAQLEKAKQLKQGMMQELLTGRVRLV